MGDAVALRSKLQTIYRSLRQRRRVLFEPPHARRRVGKIATRIEALGTDAVTFRQIARREARIAVLDPRLTGHSLKEQRIASVVVKPRLREPAKGVMNVIGWYRRRDAINVCRLQRTILRSRSRRCRRDGWGTARARTPANCDHCGWHNETHFVRDCAFEVGTASVAGKSWSVCVCEQQPTGLRDALAVGHETIGDLLALRNEFRTHCQRVVHAGFAALLVVAGGFAGDGRENETKERQPKRRPKMRKRFDSQSAGESGRLS